MASPNRLARPNVTLPAGTKFVLITGNSMLIDYSSVDPFVPTNVYECDPSDGTFSQSDGGPTMGFDPGWWAWAPDGISRRSVLPYMLQLAVNAGHASNLCMINMAQGGTDCVDWQPGGALWNRMVAALAMLKSQGVEPHLHIHYLGCWDALKGYTYVGVHGITNWFLAACQSEMPNTKMKIGKRTYINGVNPASQSAVWAGMYQAIVDRSNAGQQVSAGPDDDIDLTNVVDGVHYIDNSRYYVCNQWPAHFAGI